MEKPGTLFPRSFGSFLFPLLATMHAGEGAGESKGSDDTSASTAAASLPADGGGRSNAAPATSAAADDGDGVTGGAWGGGGRAVRSPDDRLALVARSYGRAMCELAGTPDPEGHALLQAALADAGSGGGGGEARVGHGRGQRRPAGRRGGRREGVGGGGAGGRAAEDGGRPRRGGGAEGGSGGADLAELMEKTRCVSVCVCMCGCVLYVVSRVAPRAIGLWCMCHDVSDCLGRVSRWFAVPCLDVFRGPSFSFLCARL